jgi:hypothetical protein
MARVVASTTTTYQDADCRHANDTAAATITATETHQHHHRRRGFCTRSPPDLAAVVSFYSPSSHHACSAVQRALQWCDADSAAAFSAAYARHLSSRSLRFMA